MSPRTYTNGLIAGLALMLAAAAAVNWLVDPFWYFRSPAIDGLNAVKPRFARFERHIKPQLLARERPQAIVLGSSLAEIGFDAGDAALTAGGTLRGYNFAFAGADWELVQCHFRYALAASAIRRAVIGIHPGALPAPRDCAARLPEIGDFHPAKLLLSLQVLKESARTVLEQGRGRSSHTREGRYLYARGVAGVAARFREALLPRSGNDPACARSGRLPAVPPPSRELAPGSIAPAAGLDLSGLRAVIRAARAHGVELRLFAYPRHASLVELDLVCGKNAARWAALAAIARVAAEEAPGGGVEVWDFEGYSEVTAEPIAAGNPVFWQDPEHFNYEMGSMMLAEMFGATQPGLGRRVFPGNVGAAYGAFLRERDRYLARHPWFYDDLRALLPPLR